MGRKSHLQEPFRVNPHQSSSAAPSSVLPASEMRKAYTARPVMNSSAKIVGPPSQEPKSSESGNGLPLVTPSMVWTSVVTASASRPNLKSTKKVTSQPTVLATTSATGASPASAALA